MDDVTPTRSETLRFKQFLWECLLKATKSTLGWMSLEGLWSALQSSAQVGS
jgi:hypothetical protein